MFIRPIRRIVRSSRFPTKGFVYVPRWASVDVGWVYVPRWAETKVYDSPLRGKIKPSRVKWLREIRLRDEVKTEGGYVTIGGVEVRMPVYRNGIVVEVPKSGKSEFVRVRWGRGEDVCYQWHARNNLIVTGRPQ